MELNELKLMWQAHEEKLEKSLQLNLKCLESIQTQKVRSKLTPLLWQRVFEGSFHVVIIWWLASFLYNHINELVYALSSLALIAFYGLALSNCIKQIITIKQIDYSNDVVNLQSSLETLQIHIVNYLRLTFLVIPTYLAYPIILFKAMGFDILENLNGDWWKAQIVFCILLIPICIWFYSSISYKNIHKKWVRKIIAASGNRVVKSMEFMRELERLKAGSR